MKNILSTIINSVDCHRHGKALGVPCFVIPAIKDGAFEYSPIGICNHRAKKYGCRGRISKESLLRNARER